jgi:hypothetical protein
MTYRRGLLKKCRGLLDFFEGRAAFSIADEVIAPAPLWELAS